MGSPGRHPENTENTLLRWTITSLGREKDLYYFHDLRNTTAYQQLCSSDVLGLTDSLAEDQQVLYLKLEEGLERSPGGCYQSGLPLKNSYPG